MWEVRSSVGLEKGGLVDSRGHTAVGEAGEMLSKLLDQHEGEEGRQQWECEI